MKWQLQLLRAGIKKLLPFKSLLRKLKRRVSGYKPDGFNLDTTLEDAFKVVNQLKGSGRTLEDVVVLEIGSGWFPIFPIVYSLLGAKKVFLSDLQPYMDEETFQTAKRFIVNNAERISSKLGIPADRIRSVLDHAKKPTDLGFEYHISRNPSSYLPASLNIISSRTVLEHIPEQDLKLLLPIWKSLLAPHGVMIHAIDMSDHMEHLDKSISRIHFLRFGTVAWNVINFFFDYQKRLRYPQFCRLFEAAGLRVRVADVEVDKKAESDARQMKLSVPFVHMAPEEVGILTACVLLEPIQNGHSIS
jgi:hypothetical protein